MNLRFIMLAALILAPAWGWTTVREELPPAPAVRTSPAKPAKPAAPPAEAVSRGQLLYQNHCTRCHTSIVHVREKRRADSLRSLEGWVRRWSSEEKLNWNEQEIIEVVDYVNQRFYKFQSPAP